MINHLIYIWNILSGIQAKLHLPQHFENILHCSLVSVVIDEKSTVNQIVSSLWIICLLISQFLRFFSYSFMFCSFTGLSLNVDVFLLIMLRTKHAPLMWRHFSFVFWNLSVLISLNTAFALFSVFSFFGTLIEMSVQLVSMWPTTFFIFPITVTLHIIFWVISFDFSSNSLFFSSDLFHLFNLYIDSFILMTFYF